METDFPCLPTSKKVSFALHSGAREALALAGVPASPVTPIFQSEFVHGILGAQQSVTDAFSSLRSNGVAPLPLLELKQSALVSPEKISAQSKLCCERLNSANSGNHRSSSAVHDEWALAGVLHVRALEQESGADDVGCSLQQEVPAAVPRLHQETAEPALQSSGSGLHGASMPDSGVLHHENAEFALSPCGSGMQDASMVSTMEQNRESQNGEEIWRATLVGYCLPNS